MKVAACLQFKEGYLLDETVYFGFLYMYAAILTLCKEFIFSLALL